MRIAFIGPTGSGKSTSAGLVEDYAAARGRTTARIKLADPLYQLQQQVYAAAGRSIEPYAQDQVLLEALAGELRRINPDSLAADLLRRLERTDADIIVNDDLRDPHVDAVRLRAAGFRVVRVRCAEQTRLSRLARRADVAAVRHSATTSEIDLIETDHEILNNGSVAELRSAIEQVLEALG
ncbi:hypothetical protein [Micromonospora tulbaghiae]|uniref:hypothetical protein n=1 Tax=Micromonospora tulbaghiae TaxID=479978 RepID=UPI0036B66BAA